MTGLVIPHSYKKAHQDFIDRVTSVHAPQNPTTIQLICAFEATKELYATIEASSSLHTLSVKLYAKHLAGRLYGGSYTEKIISSLEQLDRILAEHNDCEVTFSACIHYLNLLLTITNDTYITTEPNNIFLQLKNEDLIENFLNIVQSIIRFINQPEGCKKEKEALAQKIKHDTHYQTYTTHQIALEKAYQLAKQHTEPLNNDQLPDLLKKLDTPDQLISIINQYCLAGLSLINLNNTLSKKIQLPNFILTAEQRDTGYFFEIVETQKSLAETRKRLPHLPLEKSIHNPGDGIFETRLAAFISYHYVYTYFQKNIDPHTKQLSASINQNTIDELESRQSDFETLKQKISALDLNLPREEIKLLLNKYVADDTGALLAACNTDHIEVQLGAQINMLTCELKLLTQATIEDLENQYKANQAKLKQFQDECDTLLETHLTYHAQQLETLMKELESAATKSDFDLIKKKLDIVITTTQKCRNKLQELHLKTFNNTALINPHALLTSANASLDQLSSIEEHTTHQINEKLKLQLHNHIDFLKEEVARLRQHLGRSDRKEYIRLIKQYKSKQKTTCALSKPAKELLIKFNQQAEAIKLTSLTISSQAYRHMITQNQSITHLSEAIQSTLKSADDTLEKLKQKCAELKKEYESQTQGLAVIHDKIQQLKQLEEQLNQGIPDVAASLQLTENLATSPQTEQAALLSYHLQEIQQCQNIPRAKRWMWNSYYQNIINQHIEMCHTLIKIHINTQAIIYKEEKNKLQTIEEAKTEQRTQKQHFQLRHDTLKKLANDLNAKLTTSTQSKQASYQYNDRLIQHNKSKLKQHRQLTIELRLAEDKLRQHQHTTENNSDNDSLVYSLFDDESERSTLELSVSSNEADDDTRSVISSQPGTSPTASPPTDHAIFEAPPAQPDFAEFNALKYSQQNLATKKQQAKTLSNQVIDESETLIKLLAFYQLVASQDSDYRFIRQERGWFRKRMNPNGGNTATWTHIIGSLRIKAIALCRQTNQAELTNQQKIQLQQLMLEKYKRIHFFPCARPTIPTALQHHCIPAS